MYKITNNFDDKIYIGVHQTFNLDDGYMGSGTYLRASQKKHGIENFQKEILRYFDSEEEMYTEEAVVVDTNFVERSDTYNLSEGGRTAGITASRKSGCLSRDTCKGLFSKEAAAKRSEYNNSDAHKAFLVELSVRARTPEAKKKRKDTFERIGHQQGEKNSQFGKMWITNGIENTKIMKDESIPDGWRKGRVNVISKEKRKLLSEKVSAYRTGKIWITNGLEDTMIEKSMAVPVGWRKGRTLK